ncbi:MAG: zinc ribbon domain-containing protein YjdM [Alphaproteobacteria bacterium]
MTTDAIICPKCNSPYGYFDGSINICPECGYEWNENTTSDEETEVVKDANGTILADGDSVVVIKDLKIKGSSSAVKQGTVVKNITLTNEAGHNISCKITGFGAMNLKSEFVKKV